MESSLVKVLIVVLILCVVILCLWNILQDRRTKALQVSQNSLLSHVIDHLSFQHPIDKDTTKKIKEVSTPSKLPFD